MAEKNSCDITKLIRQNLCDTVRGAVVNELLARADEPGSAPGDAVFCFIVPFFFVCLVFVF